MYKITEKITKLLAKMQKWCYYSSASIIYKRIVEGGIKDVIRVYVLKSQIY